MWPGWPARMKGRPGGEPDELRAAAAVATASIGAVGIRLDWR